MSNNPKFTINNFRIFDKPQTFELAPITILTGPNNSGKSSMVKSLLMLKNEQKLSEIPYVISLPNSVIQLPRGENLLNSKKKLFQFQFDNTFLDHKFYVTVSYKLESEYLSNEPKFQDDLIFDNLEIKVENNVVLKINSVSSYDDVWNVPFIFDFKLWYEISKFIAVNKHIDKGEDGLPKFSDIIWEFGDIFLNKLLKNSNLNYSEELKKYKKIKEEEYKFPYEHKNIRKDQQLKFNEIQNQIFFDSDKFFTKPNGTIGNGNDLFISPEIGYENSTVLSIEQEIYKLDQNYTNFNLKEIIKLRLKIINANLKGKFRDNLEFHINEIPELIPSGLSKDFEQICLAIIFNEIIGNSFQILTNIDIIPAFKGNGTRYFQAGESIQSYLTKAAINLIETKNFNKDQYEKNIDFIKKWIGNEKFDIAKDIEIVNIGNRNIYTIELIDSKNRIINITDMGFGVSQLISVLLSVSFYSPEKYQNKDKPIFYLEEPESNLHPNWQSLLMELITEINQKFGIRFIIETHSEYMIRKLQFLMADKTKDLETDSALIYYFNSDKNVDESKGEPKIKKIKIDKNGGLSDNFGPGFYDEAINLEFDLLKLRNYQKN
jgi:energy-coupling factor transporter ATP-binding protein EcfA2